MLSTLSALAEAWQVAMTWEVLSLVLIGSLLGHIFGILPGLSGMVAVSILIPFTYGMSFATALAFLISILGAATIGSSIPAILVGIPGTSVSVMTVIDGHPLAKQGRPLYGITLAAVASAMGSVVSIVAFILLLPLFNRLFFLFGAPERFVFILLGLTTVAFSARGKAVNGLLGGAIGVLVSLIGFSRVAGGMRFTMGFDFLWDGIHSIPLFVGTFAIAEFIHIASGKTQAGVEAGSVTMKEPALKQMCDATMDVFRNWFLFLRCCVIGFIIGIIPGIGGSASQMITYTHAVQSAKDKSKFGHGDIRGVIGPEASTNAKDVGQLLPTFGLGIPGSVEMVVVLAAFMVHGVQPGTNLFVAHLDTVWLVIICLAIANILSSSFAIALGFKLVKWLQMPPIIYMSVILCFTMIGSYTAKFQFTDIALAFVFGVIGYLMKIYDVNRVTFVVAYILGRMLEQNFWQSVTIARGNYSIFIFNSAATIGIWVFMLFTFALYFWPDIKAIFAKKKAS